MGIGLKVTTILKVYWYWTKSKWHIGLKILLKISTYIGLKITSGLLPYLLGDIEGMPYKNFATRLKGRFTILPILPTHSIPCLP
jgi:hypothetical protein